MHSSDLGVVDEWWSDDGELVGYSACGDVAGTYEPALNQVDRAGSGDNNVKSSNPPGDLAKVVMLPTGVKDDDGEKAKALRLGASGSSVS